MMIKDKRVVGQSRVRGDVQGRLKLKAMMTKKESETRVSSARVVKVVSR